MIRTAISPRLATSTLRRVETIGDEGSWSTPTNVAKPERVPEDRSLSFDFTRTVAPLAPAVPEAPAPLAPLAPAVPEEPAPLSVAELDRAIKSAVDGAFLAPVWVEGEVTDARPASSGHLYFCLKDEREEASIEAVVYRSNVTPRMRQLAVDGARIRLRGRPTMWA